MSQLRRFLSLLVALLLLPLRILRWLLRHLLGVSWQAPAWLSGLGHLLQPWGRSMAARPAHSAGVLGVLLVLVGAGVYGWYWYSHLPQPHKVSYSVQAPPVTNYRKEGPQINPLRVVFAESVAPLELIGKPVEKGVSLSPEVAGAWHWASDRTLQFTPSADWPIGQQYEVTLGRKDLLAGGVLLDQYQSEFSTAAFSGRVSRQELYQDPTDSRLKTMVVALTFSHPVDEASLRESVAINLGKGLSYRAPQAGITPQISFDETHLSAYVHSAPLTMPLEASQIDLTLADGVHAKAGGKGTERSLRASVTVPGRYQLSFSHASIAFADNDRGEPEPVLLFSSSSAVSDEALAGKVKAWLLPESSNGWSNWSQSEVDEAMLKRSEPVTLTQVPSAEPLNSSHAFKFRGQPKRQLYVEVAGKIEAVGGYLGRDPTYSLLTMPAYPRTLRFLSDGALLSLNGERRLGIMARGVKGAHVEIARLLPNQLHHLVDQNYGNFARPSFSNEYFDRLVERMTLDVPLAAGDPAKTLYDNVDLTQYLSANGGRKGIFVLKLSPGDAPSKLTFDDYGSNDARDLRFIVVTDLGIIAKRWADGSHDVFVQSLASGEPVAEAEVEIIGRNGLPVANGKTDAQGRAHFAKLDELRREKTPLMYVVSRGNDQSFLPINQNSHRLDLSRFDVGGKQDAGDSTRLAAYLFSDRGLYRPGETAHLGMIVRQSDWKGQLQGLPLELQITDPRGMTIVRQRLTLSASGFETYDFASSEVAPAGDYTANLSLIGQDQRRIALGSTSFKVRDFEPDRMKVSLSLSDVPVAGWLAPQQVAARLKALHLFGAPASDRRITGRMVLSPTYVSFPRYADYRFLIADSLSEANQEDLAESKTDAQGQATLDLGLKRFADSTYQLQVLAQVYEAEGGRNVAAQSTLLVSPATYLVGVKSSDPLDYIAKGAKREVHWQAVDPQLEPVTVDGLHTELVEHRYVSVLVKQSDGTYRYVSRVKDLVAAAQPLVLQDGQAMQMLDTSNPGSFTLRLKDANDKLLNQVDYEVQGLANTSRSLERNAELQLKLDKRSYASGDEITVSIRAPYAGAGLITIERDKVYAQQWFKADSTSSVQHIRIPEGMEGNAYVNVQFVRDPQSPEVYMSPLSYGVQPFSINLDARRLTLKLDSVEKLEPGQTLDIHVNSARPARAVVYAVDEGILQVARYQAPDPLGLFFQKRALEVSTSQILDLILPEFSRLMSAAAPGGDADAALASHLNPFKRKRQPPVAWWSGLIDLPAGDTTLHYKVPDSFNGKLHLFAVAVDDNSIGVAEGSSEVRGALVLTPNVPAFVAPGDEFSISAGVFNNLPGAAVVKVQLETGVGLQLVENLHPQLQIEPNREGAAEFRLKSLERLGSADLKLVAELADGKRVQIGETISIRPASQHRIQLSLGRFDEKTHKLPLSRDLFGQLRKVNVGLDASPLVWAEGLRNYLDDYGYSCTEQLVSKRMPTLVWSDSTNADAQREVDGAISILRQRQNQSGGFGLWAVSPETASYASLYATDFLIQAREHGFKVPTDLLERANMYLGTLANSPSNGLGELRNRAYASYLLSRQGIQVGSALSDIRERYETYFPKQWEKDLGSAYLAASYKLSRQDKQADRLIRSMPWSSLDNTWSSDGLYYDPLVQDAEHLHLLARHFPEQLEDVPVELFDNLGKWLNQQRYNSFSAALLLRALDDYGQRAGANMSLQAKALLGERSELLTLAGKPPRSAVPLGVSALELSKQGDTPAFYLLSEAGFDRTGSNNALRQGLEVTHEFLDESGQPLQKVRVGDEFLVRLRLRAVERNHIPQVAMVDLLPGGVEPVTQAPSPPRRNSGDEDDDGEEDSSWQSPLGTNRLSDWKPDFVDVRDDRIVLYGDVSRDVRSFVYRVRATNAGHFITPGAYAEGLYDTQLQGRSQAGQLEIEAP
ncbi:alpha-2-macroglobulin [Pseudomonas sp. PDM33]|uniref:alpha-2-macroglobulin n=1 Tax=Pseudomonas sp. PDM33 TaxID=2854765 RepID=UPI001C47906E|nr:alpha-2-macroglobulin [Pseudomonas sp. PDM33]MBV7582265.1 alpha-2-macroglobulin [Pseudomonas sp. PDM33]